MNWKIKLCFCLLFLSTMITHGQNGRFLYPIFSEINVTQNIAFSEAYRIGDNELTSLYLDFYEPSGDNMAYRPLVITVFGGAFITGGRDWTDMVAYADSLSHLGYVVASIDYRLLPLLQISAQNFIRAGYAAAQDVNAAIRFFKANREQYRVDTNQIYLLGNSAGSIASLYAHFLDDDERPTETYTSPDMGNLNATGFDYYSQYDGSVAGVIAHWGGITDLNIIDDDERSPICLIHGTADVTVPYESGRSSLLAAISPTLYGSHPISLRLDSLEIENELHPFIDEKHAFYYTNTYSLDVEKFDSCFHITRDFLALHNTYVSGIHSTDTTFCDISLYPNPANDQLHIHLHNSNMNNVHFILYHINGTIVKEFQMVNPDKTIDIQDLPTGLYILSIYSRQQITHKKIIISR